MPTKRNMYGIVIFYKMNRNHTMTEIGKTKVLDAYTALNIFANVPNPESQLIQADSIQHLKEKYDQLRINVQNPDFVRSKITPYL